MLLGYLPFDGAARTNLVLRMTNSGVNQANAQTVAIASDPKPATVSDYMEFAGTQIVRFSDRSDWHVVAPYSIEMEVYPVDTANRMIGTEGEGFASGWPEWAISQTGGALRFNTSWTNNAYDAGANFVNTYGLNQWYRLALMFYLDGTQNRVRGYTNGIQVFDIPITQPLDTTQRLAIGGDAVARADRMFKGRIRNVTIGKSLFWTV